MIYFCKAYLVSSLNTSFHLSSLFGWYLKSQMMVWQVLDLPPMIAAAKTERFLNDFMKGDHFLSTIMSLTYFLMPKKAAQ